MEPKAKRIRSAAFKLEFPGSDEVKDAVKDKFRKIKAKLNAVFYKCHNNTDVLLKVLDDWISEKDSVKPVPNDTAVTIDKFPVTPDEHLEDDILLVEQTALIQLVTIVENHSSLCHENLFQNINGTTGHVSSITFACAAGHTYKWNTSSYVHGSRAKYTVNCRLTHAFYSSGIIPATYKRFCDAACIGYLRNDQRNSVATEYEEAVNQQYEESVEEALVLETAMGEAEEGISLMSDARHGTRKNAMDTSVVTIGDKSHHVISHEHITKEDDPVTQRHEYVGTERTLNRLIEKNININIWTHDRNMSVNSLLKNSKEGIISQNDCWHGLKSLKKDIAAVTTGAKKRENVTWHGQLFDKKDGVVNHVHHALRNSNGDPQLLRAKMDNAVDHYKIDHTNCDPVSRCKEDANYKPSHLVITSSIAEKLLRDAIRKTTIYKNPHDFCHGKDTHYVESFNNVLNIFQDKRICFSKSQYSMRGKLGTIHWNTNVDRGFTSVWVKPTAVGSNKRGKLKKNYKKLDYSYRHEIWKKFIVLLKPHSA